MPTHKPDRTQLSISELSDVTGFAKETVTKRLRAAGVHPVREDGRTLWFAPQEALPALYERESRWRVARGGGNGKGPLPTDFAFSGSGPLQTVDGRELCELLHWSWEDVLEGVGWSLPFVQCGRRNSPRAWRFAIAHAIRWVGFVSQALGIHEPLDLVTELRRLREAAGLPLDVPSGFVPFTKSRKEGPHHAAE